MNEHDHPTTNAAARLAVQYVKETSRARRERDIAIEMLVHATRMLGIVERQLESYRDKYYVLLDARRRDKAAA